MLNSQCRHAVTVDVEDYFHVSAFRESVPCESWDQMRSCVARNTRRVLELLAEFNIHATFFVLGWVAERYPELVREIQAAGHELGCHSYAHRLLYDLTPSAFRDDTRRALAAIEDAAGVAVRAYRAPSFSITERSLWALEILPELGFTLDSSIFPTRNHLYGIPSAPRQPFRIRVKGGDLTELPLPSRRIGKWAVPVTGGVYLRLLPLALQVRALDAMERGGEPIVLYFHPWELDPDQPRVAAPTLARLGHYARLGQTEARLRRLLGRFAFGKLSKLAHSALPAYQVTPENKSKGRGSMLTPLAK